MDAFTYITTKFDLPPIRRRLVEIPNMDRVDLARLFALLEHTRGVEVGVERGVYSQTLLAENQWLSLTCVDAWTPYHGYRDHVSAAKLERFYAETTDRLAPYHSRVTLVRKFSVDAAREVPDRSLDFVYLDAAHDLASVIADLRAWSPKVRVGGLMAGHDYITSPLPSLMHVPQAVHAWVDAYQIAPLFIVGAKAKEPGVKRDDGRSWFYIVPEPVRAARVIKQ